MSLSSPRYAEEYLPDMDAASSTARAGALSYPRWYPCAVIAVLTALPVTLFMLVPLVFENPELEAAQFFMWMSILVGVVAAGFLFRRLLKSNPAVPFRSRLVLLAIVAGLELVVWPGIWVFAIPADPMENTLWKIASPHQPPVADITGKWEARHWMAVADGSFTLHLGQRSAESEPIGVLNDSPTDQRRWSMKWVLAHSARSGDEVRLHFRPEFPFFWVGGYTYVGTITEVGPDKVALQMEGLLFMHRRGKGQPMLNNFRARRE